MDESNTFEQHLSLLPWTKTKVALNELQELLKCNTCQNLPTNPQYVGLCDHFFCEECISKCDNICPVCKLPTAPSEKKPDTIVRGLVSSVSDLITIINGGKVQSESQGLEAPAICDKFYKNQNQKAEKTSNHNTRTPVINKEIISKASKSRPNSDKENTIAGVSKNRTNLPARKIVKKPAQSSSKTALSANSHTEENKPQNSLSIIDLIDAQQTPKNKTEPKLINKSSFVTPVTPAVNKRNAKGETVLHSTCIKGDVSKLKDLLENGANPNTTDNAGWTPLHEACSHGYEAIAVLLLEHGALVDVPGSNNMTPLHDAVLTQTIPVISLLRRWGASDHVRDIWGRTPRTMADLVKNPGDIHDALNTEKSVELVSKVVQGPLEKKVVFMDSGLNPAEKKKLDNVTKLLKIKLVNDFNSDVTHVIVSCDAGQMICQRTMKYMMGVVSGKWILSSQWLDACLSVGGPVSPFDYEVKGTRINPDSFAPQKGRYNAAKMLPGLFSGCRILFFGSFNTGANIPPKRELEALVRAGDGVLINREPNPESIDVEERTVPYHCPPDDPLGACSHFCIYPQGLQEPLIKYDMAHIKTLPLSWLYDCVDTWTLVSPQFYK